MDPTATACSQSRRGLIPGFRFLPWSWGSSIKQEPRSLSLCLSSFVSFALKANESQIPVAGSWLLLLTVIRAVSPRARTTAECLPTNAGDGAGSRPGLVNRPGLGLKTSPHASCGGGESRGCSCGAGKEEGWLHLGVGGAEGRCSLGQTMVHMGLASQENSSPPGPPSEPVNETGLALNQVLESL